ncbi:glycosyltransferase [Bacterioplanoides sp.]|uniref:glycosyltransferase n=1 Tax=Bacterioplanoides sp. TaxID=2066072 RepID=UPI003B59B737
MIDNVTFVLPKRYYGGMEVSNQKLMDYFSRNFSVTVSAYVQKGGGDNNPYICNSCETLSLTEIYFSVLKWYKNRRQTLFVINGVFPLLCMLLIPFRVNAVYQLHCTLEGNNELKQFKRIILKSLVAICTYRFKVYCVSESLADEVRGYKLSNYNAVSFSPNVLDDYKIRAFNDISRLSFVGRISHQKDPIFAVDVFREFSRTDTGLKLSMIGEGHLTNKIKQKASTLNIDFPGWLDQPYLAGSALLFTSNYEGYGLVIIEALANGCLVVARDAPHGPSDILSKIDKDMIVPFDSGPEAYVDCLNLLRSKYSSKVEREQLKDRIYNYLKYLNDIRFNSWDVLL